MTLVLIVLVPVCLALIKEIFSKNKEIKNLEKENRSANVPSVNSHTYPVTISNIHTKIDNETKKITEENERLKRENEELLSKSNKKDEDIEKLEKKLRKFEEKEEKEQEDVFYLRYPNSEGYFDDENATSGNYKCFRESKEAMIATFELVIENSNNLSMNSGAYITPFFTITGPPGGRIENVEGGRGKLKKDSLKGWTVIGEAGKAKLRRVQ